MIPIVEPDDAAAMAKAVETARATWPTAVEHHRGGGKLSAKFPFPTRRGGTEHLWIATAPDGERTLRTVMTRFDENAMSKAKSALDLLLERGETKGLRTLLADQLRQRFADAGDEIDAQLAGADAGQLQRWGRSVLTATTLDDVFAPE